MKNHRIKLQFPAGINEFTDVNQTHWHANDARCVTLPAETDLACFLKAGFVVAPPRAVTLHAPAGIVNAFDDSNGETFPIDQDGNITLDLDQHTLHDALHAGFIVVS